VPRVQSEGALKAGQSSVRLSNAPRRRAGDRSRLVNLDREGLGKMKRQVLAFDLDNTLADSKSPITARMGGLLDRLLKRFQVCVISGASSSSSISSC